MLLIYNLSKCAGDFLDQDYNHISTRLINNYITNVISMRKGKIVDGDYAVTPSMLQEKLKKQAESSPVFV